MEWGPKAATLSILEATKATYLFFSFIKIMYILAQSSILCLKRIAQREDLLLTMYDRLWDCALLLVCTQFHGCMVNGVGKVPTVKIVYSQPG